MNDREIGIGPLRIGEPIVDGSFLSALQYRGLAPSWQAGSVPEGIIPEATTVLALTWCDGVIMAGDRRATAGNVIAHRRMRKVYPSDEFSVVAISGTAGMAIELIKLFQTELEHYEKIEGTRLSLEGKANFLARMIRGNLPLAFQGLVVIPLFCGFDERTQIGHLYSFDIVGGRYDELSYAATGSGGSEAKSFLKAAWKPDLTREEALALAVEALVAASEEDAATGGPDLRRGIYPSLVLVTEQGVEEIPDEVIEVIAATVMEGRPQ